MSIVLFSKTTYAFEINSVEYDLNNDYDNNGGFVHLRVSRNDTDKIYNQENTINIINDNGNRFCLFWLCYDEILSGKKYTTCSLQLLKLSSATINATYSSTFYFDGNSGSISSGNIGFSGTGDIRYYSIVGATRSFKDVLSLYSDIGCPVFYSFSADTDYSDALNYLRTGEIRNSLNEMIPQSINIGHIKNTSYKLDNTSILQSPSNFREYISWDTVKSSSGYEYNSTDNVKFFIKDRSYKTKINNVGIGEVADQVITQLQKWVYPKGSAQNMLASGEAVKTSSYGNMVYVGDQLATLGNYSFNSLSKMQNLSDSDLQNYLSEVTGGTGNYSWMQKVSNWVSGNSINVNVAYDIYCYIQSGSKNGDWYRINFHDTPVPQRGDRVNGGITVSPVKPQNPFTPDESGDWFNAPEFDDDNDNINDDENNEEDNGLSVYYHTDDGDTYITNNYTYNYDNRSWVENHFDNNTIEEVNEGFEWIKLFGGIFSIFLILFGAFLPGWAVAVVTISIPVIIGLILFKVIKGVVPFV